MSGYATVAPLNVAPHTKQEIADICGDVGVEPSTFWGDLASIVHDLEPRNKELLDKRDELQEKIDAYLTQRQGKPINIGEYRKFLYGIGYLVDNPERFQATTENVDPEIATIAGPQLVTPITNARYALNAANARWGSLYDAFYGTDIIPEGEGTEKGTKYNPERGRLVVEKATQYLNQFVGLKRGGHGAVTSYELEDTDNGKKLVAVADKYKTSLKEENQFVGYTQHDDGSLASILLKHNDLHIDIQIDRNHAIGAAHQAGISNIGLESAITTIQDCEDAVSRVGDEDFALAYRNMRGLYKGDLEERITDKGEAFTRRLNADRMYTTPNGGELVLPGRSLMLYRNVGIHMYTDVVTTAQGDKTPEGFLDAMVTGLAAKYDLDGIGARVNSKTGSVYIVKPKLHGPEEVAATVNLLERVEQALDLPQYTLKIGIMDEEQRTTVNLAACIEQAKERVIFINTGFLDRTGDLIHTVMHAGPLETKANLKAAGWIKAYEDLNVDVGLECGLKGRSQIGKGMFAMPDEMAAMLKQKIDHPNAGASTAWVPSPTAATLHALHYHMVNVSERQEELMSREKRSIDEVLDSPFLTRQLTEDEIQAELDNNAQGILGYVVHWVDQGVGCSKVPDINNVGLMEDRATLRISSQHIANWLHHGIVDEQRVKDAFGRMAAVVDGQNTETPGYRSLVDNPNGPAFQAALDLVFEGMNLPNGYTEPVLHRRRREVQEAA